MIRRRMFIAKNSPAKNFQTKNVPTKNPPAKNSPGTVLLTDSSVDLSQLILYRL
jgi:hypothetical protein